MPNDVPEIAANPRTGQNTIWREGGNFLFIFMSNLFVATHFYGSARKMIVAIAVPFFGALFPADLQIRSGFLLGRYIQGILI